ncbi:MAG: hypothetical protein CMH64_04130 [Nanoarchaeota archaeon]|nr:hypothetical protein [Nanoarchaeota archaeon]
MLEIKGNFVRRFDSEEHFHEWYYYDLMKLFTSIVYENVFDDFDGLSYEELLNVNWMNDIEG